MKVSCALSIAAVSLPLAVNAFSISNGEAVSNIRLSVLAEPIVTVEKPINGEAKAAEWAMPESEIVVDEVIPTPSSSRMVIEPGRYAHVKKSLTLPWLPRPTSLDGTHAGDVGFDPLGFSESYDLYTMQEAEIRHGRLAMLAVVGWPLAELFGPKFLLQEGGRAPSVLNGFGHSYGVSFLGVLAAFSAVGYFEYKTALRSNVGTKFGDLHAKDMEKIWEYGVAGDYNWDPMNYYSLLGDDCNGRKALREVEITQGRYAMVGITAFAIWEALTGHAIVENNMFFHPNAFLPFLAVSYFAWSQIYEISDVTEYPIKIQYTKDGEEMLRQFNDQMKRTMKDNEQNIENIKEISGKVATKADVVVNALKDQFEESRKYL